MGDAVHRLHDGAMDACLRQTELLEKVARALGGPTSMGGLVSVVDVQEQHDGGCSYTYRDRDGEVLAVVRRIVDSERCEIRWEVEWPVMKRIEAMLAEGEHG